MESTGHEMTRTLHRSRFASYFRNAVVESQRVREASLVEEEVRCPQAHSLNSLTKPSWQCMRAQSRHMIGKTSYQLPLALSMLIRG